MKCRRVKHEVLAHVSDQVLTPGENIMTLTRRHFISFASCVCNQIFLESAEVAACDGITHETEIVRIILA